MSTIKTGLTETQRTVYYGPHATTYPSIGTVNNGESVTAYWTEGSWVHIQYQIGSTSSYKRGYIAASSINVTENIGPIASPDGTRYVITADKVYSGPANTGYFQNASLFACNSVTYLGEKPNGYAHVEFDIGGGKKKRGYYYANNLSTTAPTGGLCAPSGYIVYQKGDTVPIGMPYAGSSVNQGFNDFVSDYKGHLGYDIGVSGSVIKPIMAGTVVSFTNSNVSANGRAVCIKHTVGSKIYYSTYCHLASVYDYNATSRPDGIKVGMTVTTATKLGMMGGSGSGSDTKFSPHLHLCVYTVGSGTLDPNGYCSSGFNQTFQQTAGSNYHVFYYGSDTTAFPRCGGVRFFDPYGVITSNAAIITNFA